MSWGERSCKKHDGGCEIANEKICNPDCIDYESNGKEPDTPGKINKVEEKAPKESKIVRSTLPHFSKKSEFVVLKRKVFSIQSVSPKKIILKLKGTVEKGKLLPDGIYNIKQTDGKLQDV